MRAPRSSAGGYEQERFEGGRRAWRRRVLPRLRWITFPIFVVCLVYAILGPVTKLQFVAGLLAGGAVTLYLWIRDEPPEHVRRHGEGAAGERATARVLQPLLDEGWRVVHDIDTGRGNRDHVLVGPPGVFLLDSKKLGGTVTVEGDTVRVERIDDERDSYALPKLAAAMRGQAARLHGELLTGVGVKAWVTAVVVFWSPFDSRVVEGDKIVFVHGDELVAWLRGRPARHDERFITDISHHLG